MYIGIDFEYHTNPSTYDLICACCTAEDGSTEKFWLRPGPLDSTDKLIAYLEQHKGDIFIAHALDVAESVCFRILGLEPCDWKFIDTFSLAKILDARLTEKIRKSVRTITTVDGDTIEKDEDKDKDVTCSLAACVRNRLFVEINTERKEEMRKLCIALEVDGHEDEIMEYCLDDTKHLIPLAKNMLSEYQSALDHSLPVGNCEPAPSAEEVALDIGYTNNCCSEIAMRGIAVNRDRVQYLIDHAAELLKKAQDELNDKYPGVFQYEGSKKDPKRKFVFKKDVLLNEYILPVARNKGIHWPTTDKGSYSITDKFIKSIRDVDPLFEDYHTFYKVKSAFSNMAKKHGTGKNWLDNYDAESGRIYYQSLRPYTSNTFRCQPSTSKGFIPGWAKVLFCLLDPPEGSLLVEHDYKSEETAIQAALCNDNKYRELYNSKDLYLWIATAIGLVPKKDFDELDKDELKHKYADVRDRAKRFFLGYSYGAGAVTLSQQCNITEAEAQKFVYKTDTTFDKAVKYKTRWIYRTQNPTPRFTHWRLPDNTVVRVKRKSGEKSGKETVIKNWQFQAFGGVIIRKIIKWAHEKRVPVFATVHDAIWTEFSDDDKKQFRCDWIAAEMKRIADEVLGEDIMKVGSPDIVEHGKLWSPKDGAVEDWIRLTGVN